MSYQVLARKWRPKRFQDVIGQSHITKSLQNALSRNKLGHAYILTGTRGIGKTSVARIFAKAIRCESRLEDSNACGTCESCQDFDSASSMNVVEIDGASNNSVDDIRDLIGNIQYLPTSGHYKIYIIDEVHMLSTSAFNALLKTLEEPPAHAIFILATTEPEKLLGTVLSRCQRFDFRNAAVADLSAHVKKIAESENIQFENDEIIKQICVQGKGSVRDTLSLLDQVLSFSEDGKVTEQSVSFALGLAKTSVIIEIVSKIINGNRDEVVSLYKNLLNENISVKNICHSLLDEFYLFISQIDNPENLKKRWPLVDATQLESGEIFWIYESISKDVSWTLSSLSPENCTEIALQKVTLRNSFFNKAANSKKKINNPEKTEEKTSTPVSIEDKPQVQEEKEIEVVAEVSVAVEESVSATTTPTDGEEVKEETEEIDIKEEFSKMSSALENSPTVEIKTNELENKISKKEEILKEKSVEELPRDWDGFLAYLFKVSPASSANLEQGNILSPLSLTDNSVSIEVGFPESSRVFLDYLKEQESFDKLKDLVAKFFNVDVTKVNLQLAMVEEEKAIDSEFKSKAQLKQQEEDRIEEEKREKIRSNPFIRKAETIFNSKVDKIIISKNENN
ncbi:DNA polymerase III, tau subunit [Halobacteriovorax marinus SJ]|uniref:DNA polymerase III subunit gamma/tau n=1 Tax=Halobacteriovorax marinus (strain ATCC BAA-682 / DSM 15412 / SJ) TaxID=862908 RepID=E1X1S3_HALMS|nr:DNA polymerase III subunit gamma/tau [Halobacteriovorax marinus]CBW24992.1 DNA polymerase III, tau subunit [Halobacteriovorax marinus SJ]